MAKPEPWRQDATAYPVITTVPLRYSDLDTMGHVNNVAMASIFETARVHLHHLLGQHPVDLGTRWLVAAVYINYLREAHPPQDMIVRSAIGHIGHSSWTLFHAAFQNDVCVATGDTVMVVHGPKDTRVISPELRAIMDTYKPTIAAAQDAR
ncbi:acyl-CoA thioesterase [Sphingobium subterraneum]|uniref:Acyl-CoA thioester hydrolase n=1 Tax=Sphingobium subterraneum TaxID=627688 RepID=A0A841J0X4_9SPHN|nr:thioesterase family protein [Sphingobium subterraneum]MBB6124290.1 acyl-CoA thioester hydrolase [Sphingobium subterraneum]